MNINYQNVLTLRAALQALDGIDQPVEVRGQLQLVKKPFTFSGRCRLKIARNLRAVEDAFQDYDAARIGLVRELANGAEKVPDELLPRFHTLHFDLLQEDIDVPLTQLTAEELNLDDNQIPHGALAIILQYLIQMEV
jgi:hypothetical protein